MLFLAADQIALSYHAATLLTQRRVGSHMNEKLGKSEEIKVWLASTSPEWLEQVNCDSIPPTGIGRAQADYMLRLDAVYQAAKAKFPEWEFNEGELIELVDHVPHHGEMQKGHECSQAPWWPNIGQVVAAGHLGSVGKLDTVLVALDLLSNGYSDNASTGKPLTWGYEQLLVLVASFTGASTFASINEVRTGPGYWEGEWGKKLWYGPYKPHFLSWIANPSLSPEQRARATEAVFGPSPDKLVSSGLGRAGQVLMLCNMLGIDSDFLGPERVEEARAQLEDFESHLLEMLGETRESITSERIDEALADEEKMEAWYDQDFDNGVSGVHTVALISTHIDRLLNDAAGISGSDSVAVSELPKEHRWIKWWAKTWVEFELIRRQGSLRDRFFTRLGTDLP